MDKQDIRILLVDDEADIVEIIGYNLAKEGYKIITASNGKEAVKKALKERPQLIIMDVMMPVMNGFEACAHIRTIPELQDTIVTFLTARGEDISHLEGFDAGADDYITKPITPKMLVGKVRALLRRAMPDTSSPALQLGELIIHREEYKIIHQGQEFALPKKEFELLALFATKPNKVFTREEILEKVWGNEVIVGDRTIDVHVRKLREKLGDGLLKTVKGVGYKLVD